jgi:excisionase family DNA binding protein
MQHDNDITRGFLRPAEFAEALGVSVITVQVWVRDGRLPAVRLGRLILIPEDALRRVADRQEAMRGS